MIRFISVNEIEEIFEREFKTPEELIEFLKKLKK